MGRIETREQLMIYLINLIGEKFPQSAILKGGMVLKLFDCPRYTNDIDYVFIPFQSKKEIVSDLLSLLDGIEKLEYSHNMNSKALRIKINYCGIRTQIEASVSMECPAIPVSTSSASADVNQLGHIINVMEPGNAMAHKLAAWNERNLIRDLYDVQFFFTKLQVKPDIDVLRSRLQKISYTKRNRNPKSMSLQEFEKKLRNYLEGLRGKDMDELRDILPSEEIAGLEYRLKSNLLKLCDHLEVKIIDC